MNNTANFMMKSVNHCIDSGNSVIAEGKDLKGVMRKIYLQDSRAGIVFPTGSAPGYFVIIGRQHEKHVDVVPVRGGYRPRLLKSKQLFVLQGLPSVGPTLAKRLIQRFKSVSRVICATADELSEVDGIGPASSAKIREVLDGEVS